MNNSKQEIRKKREQIFREIQKSYKNNQLIPFLGAGFSLNIASYPTFEDFINNNLAERLCTVLNLSKDKKYDLWKIFKGNPNEAIEYFIWQMGLDLNKDNLFDKQKVYTAGKGQFCDELIREFKKVDNILIAGNENEWKQHFLLIKLFDVIYTTNWDIAIEMACNYLIKKGVDIGWKKRFSDKGGNILSKASPNMNKNPNRMVEIIKYHGDLEHCESIIAGETDYYERFRRNDRLDEEFKRVLAEKDILFIGYSLGDVNVKYHMNQINFLNAEFGRNRKKYWLTIDNPQNKDTEINEIRVEFLSSWRELETCYLFDGESTKEEKRDKLIEIFESLNHDT